jgi:H+-translocating NAD(P) transhydrogenase subunit beta
MNPATYQTIANLTYVVAAVLFILGLKGLTHPRTAVRGNTLGALGMLLAAVITLLHPEIARPWGYIAIIAGLVIGTVIGLVLAVRIAMTAMPQLVALFNGFGGAASVLVAGAALKEVLWARGTEYALLMPLTYQMIIATAASGLIGAVTFWGSLVAFAKLQELKQFRNPLHFGGQHLLNAAVALIVLILAVLVILYPEYAWLYWLLVLAASILGILLVMPIGGADMPVVIALLNSYSGLAAAATGFVLGNTVLIIAGSLVGASGLILTRIMCVAMNRSLTNVLFGKIEAAGAAASQDEVYEGRIKATTADEVAMLLDGVRRVVIVPGYGMAVAQAQHAVQELYTMLEERGVEVEFGIHPVAGRMPGHMNVLLAEADIPYDKLKDLDEINPTFSQTDLVIVNGANDVVNPDARQNPNSPIAGMPILNVDQARTVIVVKRSLSPGFAGIPNPLFAADNCLMFFGDGKKTMLDLVAALKET